MPSEYGQDQWVIGLTEGKKGFFLDTGAGHPVDGSNTDVLEKAGWDGICAEPVPDYFHLLKLKRRCHCFNVALSDQPGQVEFTFADVATLSGIYACFTPEAKARNNADSATKKVIEAWTMERLLDEGRAPKHIDYWSLDTEGSEWLLVKSFPWHKHTVFAISIEHNNEEPKRTLIRDFLTSKNYTYIQRPDAPYEDYYVLHTGHPQTNPERTS
jgi:FkbM family methyltransferase